MLQFIHHLHKTTVKKFTAFKLSIMSINFRCFTVNMVIYITQLKNIYCIIFGIHFNTILLHNFNVKINLRK